MREIVRELEEKSSVEMFISDYIELVCIDAELTLEKKIILLKKVLTNKH